MLTIDVTDSPYSVPRDGSDARQSIQSAIDFVAQQQAGGTVYVPAGTYTLGVPGASTNRPLVMRSNVRLLGDGAGKTIIRVCDNARQPSERYSYALNAAALVVASSPWWFMSPSDRTVQNIVVQGLTLDGNKEHQPYIYAHGNATVSPRVPDPMPTLGAQVIAGMPSLPPGRYGAFVSYTDSLGNETGIGKAFPYYPITVSAGQFVRLMLPPTPAGAAGVVVYFREARDFDRDTNPGYERRVFPLPPTGTIDIHDHAPGVITPGPGVINFFGNSGSSCGLYLDSTSNVRVVDCEIKEFVLEGILANDNCSNVTVKRSWFHDLGRASIAATGSLYGLSVTDSTFVDCAQGMFSVESANVVQLVRFARCKSLRSGMGVNLHAVAAVSPTGQLTDMRFEQCLFDDNFQHFHASGGVSANGVSRCEGIVFEGCTFGYAVNAGVVVQSPGFGSFRNCRFVGVARPHNYNLADPYARDAIVIEFMDGSWSVEGCWFSPYSDVTFASGAPQIQIDPGVKGVRVIGNQFEMRQFPGGPMPSGVLIASSGVGSLANHYIAGNVGGGMVQEV